MKKDPTYNDIQYCRRLMKTTQLPVPHFLSVPEVGRICGVSRNTVYNWVKRGELASYQTPGRTNLIRPGDLLLFMQEHDMFVPAMLQQMADEDAARVGFVPRKSPAAGKHRPNVICVCGAVEDDELVSLSRYANVKVMKTAFEALHDLTISQEAHLLLLRDPVKGLSAADTIQKAQELRRGFPCIYLAAQANLAEVEETSTVLVLPRTTHVEQLWKRIHILLYPGEPIE